MLTVDEWVAGDWHGGQSEWLVPFERALHADFPVENLSQSTEQGSCAFNGWL